MSATPGPTKVGAAVMCRIKLAGGAVTYTTRRMTLAEAETIADRVEQEVRDIHVAVLRGDHSGPGPLIDFPAATCEKVRVRAERITAIEVLRADAFAGVTQP